MKTLLECVEDGVAHNLVEVQEQVAFQASVRRDMAAKLENYTCDDPLSETSTPVREETWSTAADKEDRHVLIMHDRPASQIHVVQLFIDEDECRAMEESAKPILHRATVADGSGGSKYSEHRKAMQAGIKVPWDKEEEGDPIARLSRRVYDYTNHVLGLELEEFGQEDLMSIQYFGRGRNDTAPDRYMPHCKFASPPFAGLPSDHRIIFVICPVLAALHSSLANFLTTCLCYCFLFSIFR